jgi:hypothetical protein
MPSLDKIATLVRSKNAGPFLITFDIMCDNEAAYRRIAGSGALSPHAIGKLYNVEPQHVSLFDYPAAYSFKVTIPRSVSCGHPADADVYGAQQHVLIGAIEIA